MCRNPRACTGWRSPFVCASFSAGVATRAPVQVGGSRRYKLRTLLRGRNPRACTGWRSWNLLDPGSCPGCRNPRACTGWRTTSSLTFSSPISSQPARLYRLEVEAMRPKEEIAASQPARLYRLEALLFTSKKDRPVSQPARLYRLEVESQVICICAIGSQPARLYRLEE